jgi:putative flippase GtrA
MKNVASRQALCFLVVGACAALVHFLVLVSIVSFTSIAPAWANTIAFLVAFSVSFLGHFYLTFSKSDSSSKYQPWHQSLPLLGKWFASSVAGFIANQALFLFGLNWFGERYYILVWIIVTGIITIMTFALGKFWAFKS